jgi:DNA-directed RNA polymerase subunit RPC12/RpoP
MSISYNDEQAYKYELKINQLEMEKLWERELFRNSWLSGDQKIVLLVIREIIHKLRYDDSELVHIHVAEIVNRTGLGDRTVRRIVTQLDEYGLITRECRRKRNGNIWISEMWISMKGHVIRDAKTIVIPARGHGGTRIKCESCGSENTETFTGYKCLDCGNIGHVHEK